MIIMKFGGTSVGSAENIKQVVKIVAQTMQEHDQVIVVCSAMGGVTDELIALSRLAEPGNASYRLALEALSQRHRSCARTLLDLGAIPLVPPKMDGLLSELADIVNGIARLGECSVRSRDRVMSFGERLSTLMVCEALRKIEPLTVMLDTRSIVKTDASFGNARVLQETFESIRQHVAGHPLCVATGFIGSTMDGVTTTLGRGGSDYTASLFGAALGVDEIQIWTDVDGVLTADPRVVQGAQGIEQMSYEEAMEMSHFGAKVIYPPTMQPARERDIPIVIKNTFNPTHPGTRIVQETKPNGPVKGISCIKQVALLRVSGSGMVGVAGTAARMFQALAQVQINVMMITQGSSEHSLCVVVQPQDAQCALSVIRHTFVFELQEHQIDEIALVDELSVIAVVGEQMRNVPGIAGRMFGALGNAGVNVVAIAQGSSERNVSMVVAASDVARGMQAIHDVFFASSVLTSGTDELAHVYLAGVGNIGSEVLTQLLQVQAPVHVKGLLNTSSMVLGDVSIDEWRDRMAQGESSSWERFTATMHQDVANRKIFVDCTSSQLIADSYSTLLASGIGVVAANKKAMSGPRDDFSRLRPWIDRGRFRFETNVCAGLPVIRTLQSLRETGDEILEIEGVLSGTFSYLFNTYDGMGSFADCVGKAEALGYTEPDPREDLSGTDVARKLLILARVMGLDLDLGDIAVENLSPVSCQDVQLEDFLDRLREHDESFRFRVDQALAQGQRLRYLGMVKDGQASVRLQAVGSEHPSYRLSGSDNLISIRTSRYHDRPLVIQGPGAGAHVTAAGVVSDILSFL